MRDLVDFMYNLTEHRSCLKERKISKLCFVTTEPDNTTSGKLILSIDPKAKKATVKSEGLLIMFGSKDAQGDASIDSVIDEVCDSMDRFIDQGGKNAELYISAVKEYESEVYSRLDLIRSDLPKINTNTLIN